MLKCSIDEGYVYLRLGIYQLFKMVRLPISMDCIKIWNKINVTYHSIRQLRTQK